MNKQTKSIFNNLNRVAAYEEACKYAVYSILYKDGEEYKTIDKPTRQEAEEALRELKETGYKIIGDIDKI